MIAVFDTSVCTRNLGDEIIMDSVMRELDALYEGEHIVRLQSQDVIWRPTHRVIRDCSSVFVGGTNLLSSQMNKRERQWRINYLDAILFKNVFLLGVGWWQYQRAPNLYTRALLRTALAKDRLHSVRDAFTQRHLSLVGLSNLVNTGCPTMWTLDERHCAGIPEAPSRCVVTTLTDYRADPVEDAWLINELLRRYERVFFWSQGAGDTAYLESMEEADRVVVLRPRVSALDALLRSGEDVEFVGTRLHAGIRALQCRRRTLIIGIDNRAAEISRDTALPTVPRGERDEIAKALSAMRPTRIKMPFTEISLWRSTFGR